MSSIRKNLMLLVILAVLPALAILLYSGEEQRQASIENAKKNVSLLADVMAESQRDVARVTRQMLSTLSLLPQIRALDIQATNQILKAVIKNNPGYHNMVLIDLNGKIIASNRPFSEVYLGDRKHFREAVESKDFAAGEYILTRVGQPSPVFPFAYPVLDEKGNLIAVLSTVVDLTFLTDFYQPSQQNEQAILSATDWKGFRLFFYPSKESTNAIGQPINPTAWDKASHAQEPGVFIGQGSDGVRRIYAFKQIRLDSGTAPYMYVWSGVPESYALESANKHLARNVSLMLFAAVLSLFVSWTIGKRAFISPINNLIDMTREFSGGNFEFRSNLPRQNNEFGTLIKSFYEMSDRLQSSQGALIQSEEKTRLILDSTAEAIYGLDSFGNCTFCNQSCLNILGYGSEEELLGRNMHDMIHHTTIEGLPNPVKDCQIFKSFQHGEKIHIEIEHIWKADGTSFPVEIWSHPIQKDAVTIGAVVTFIDITKQKQSEEKRIKLESQLRQSQKMEAVGTMAGGIAHDFNNILAIIGGNLELVQHKQNSGASAEENVAHMKEATNRAKNLVAQILAFSRQEKPELVSTDLVKSVTDTLKLLRSTTPATIEIMTTFAGESIVVNADTTQMQQVIINLFSNAAHAMDDKGLLTVAIGKVELGAADIPKAGNLDPGPYAKISVSDTGTGMDKQTLERIFDPFYTTKEVGIGTGMGLSVVHGIVDQHGGFIAVDSTVGAGSTFNIFLPVINEGVSIQPVDKEPSLPIGTERILFVDDEESIAYTCNELLEYQGYKVTSVTSGIEALDLFKANPDAFDLVFTDQTMPVMTGAELATELLKIRPDLPIILCSGYSAKMSESEAKGIGIREFCMKPMDMKKLATVVRKVLDESGGAT